MENKESLYIKILIWAYEKSIDGFTEEELYKAFDLNEPSLSGWYLKVFRDSPNLLINNFKTIGDKSYWCLTAEGMSNAINYLELKETQKGSKRAENIALWAIIVSSFVGMVQIMISVCNY